MHVLMENDFKQIAGLIGDPIRSTILWELTSGRPMTATELGCSADTTPQNISNHLSKLIKAGLLVVENQGRHRYYRIDKWEVAYMIEALTLLMPGYDGKSQHDQAQEPHIKYCRTCYDHLAGRIGVGLMDAMLKQKIMVQKGSLLELTDKGRSFFEDMGIRVDLLLNKRRILAKSCLDWTEKRYHLAGSLGAAWLEKMLSLDYIRKVKNSRAVIVTSKGAAAFYRDFKLSII
jgi:DNA-binding transcriptional ArsR family regulator